MTHRMKHRMERRIDRGPVPRSGRLAGVSVHRHRPERASRRASYPISRSLPETLLAMERASAVDRHRIIARIDADLIDLVPGYIENRRKDVPAILDALGRGDMECVWIIGHSMKGSGGGYGLHTVSEVGAALEQAAKVSDADAVTRALARLQDYLARVEVVCEPDPE
jgi:HPt (histidine-containing phosphotransfer) domain-containing protein